MFYMYFMWFLKTLTGKEIEIDIEPTDKVQNYYESHFTTFNNETNTSSTVIVDDTNNVVCINVHHISVHLQVERIKERVEEKEGIPPQQQRLIYSGKQM